MARRMKAKEEQKIIKLAILAVGGQGGGVLTNWITDVAERNGYDVRFGGIGDYVPDVGHPTQTAFFTRRD